MEFDLNEYIKNNRTEHGGAWQPAMTKKVECADGFTMSVQASGFHYSSPRENTGPYIKVEVGFPSEKPKFFAEFAEQDEDYIDTVYGYVPVELVEQEIEFHGGLKQLALPASKEK